MTTPNPSTAQPPSEADDNANETCQEFTVRQLRAERDAAQKVSVRLREALESLRYEQNGCPMFTREKEWNAAYDKANVALADTSDLADFVLVKREEWERRERALEDMIEIGVLYAYPDEWNCAKEGGYPPLEAYDAVNVGAIARAALQPASETKGTT